jgi:plastocyanin
MKRREFVGKLGVSSAALISLSGSTATAAGTQEHHGHGALDGPLASATVSFGAWPSTPYDRLAPPAPGPPPNVHLLLPQTVTIKVGGSVNFIVAGFHNIAVYGPPKKVADVNVALTMPTPGAPPGFPPLIDDPDERVFRGVFAFGMSQDRVEVVHFTRPGRHLVICAFLPHFNDNMYGWVRVLR